MADEAMLEGLDSLADGSLVVREFRDQRYRRLEVPRSSSPDDEDQDLRTETERDRARLGYSAYLRRLAGVTQVVSPDLTSARLHTRASHTHKVALVAREIAEHLVRRAQSGDRLTLDGIKAAGGLDVSACEAAALAHDLGHPPFGHAGESELDRLLLLRGQAEGFEGNAQSFRIVTVLDSYKSDVQGLNLTAVTLGAILKYPWMRDIHGSVKDDGRNELHQKFSAYRSEERQLRAVRDLMVPGNEDRKYPDQVAARPVQTLEASIMDLADDIAYSIHDLEDFISTGVIDVRAAIIAIEQAQLWIKSGGDGGEENTFTRQAAKLEKYEPDVFDRRTYGFALTRIATLLDQYAEAEPATLRTDLDLTLRGILSSKVNAFFSAIRLGEFKSGGRVRLSTDEWHDMQVLKLVTKRQLVATARMGALQQSQTRVIESLFVGLEEWLLRAEDEAALPTPLREALANTRAAIPAPEASDSTSEDDGLTVVDAPRAGQPRSRGARRLTPPHYRAIVDYICGMSDAEALLRSQWVTGTEVPGMASIGVLH